MSREDVLREALRNLVAMVDRYGWMATVNGDWACAECKPDSDMIATGFKCQYHAAVAALASTACPPQPRSASPVLDALVASVEASVPPSAALPDCGRCHRCLKGVMSPDGILPVTSTRMIVCPACHNKRCPKASDCRLACTGSNEPGQVGSVHGGPSAALPATFDFSTPKPLATLDRVADMSLPCPACFSDGGSCSLCKGTVMRRTSVGSAALPVESDVDVTALSRKHAHEIAWALRNPQAPFHEAKRLRLASMLDRYCGATLQSPTPTETSR